LIQLALSILALANCIPEFWRRRSHRAWWAAAFVAFAAGSYASYLSLDVRYRQSDRLWVQGCPWNVVMHELKEVNWADAEPPSPGMFALLNCVACFGLPFIPLAIALDVRARRARRRAEKGQV